MEDFPERIAELLERITGKVRSLTVDRVARITTIVALALVAITLVGLAIIFLFLGIFRILGELLGDMELAYAVVGGVFVIAGVLMWIMRSREPEEA